MWKPVRYCPAHAAVGRLDATLTVLTLAAAGPGRNAGRVHGPGDEPIWVKGLCRALLLAVAAKRLWDRGTSPWGKA